MFKYVKLEFSRRYDDYLMSKNTKCKISSVLYKSTKLSTCLKYFKYLANCVVSTEEFLRNTIQSFTSYNDKNTLIKKQNTFEGNENFVSVYVKTIQMTKFRQGRQKFCKRP